MKNPIESLPSAWYDDENGSTPLVAERVGESISLVDWTPIAIRKRNRSKILMEKPLTASQRQDKLLSRLKLKAIEMRFGRMVLDVTVHDGQITEIECTQQTERWRAD